MISIAVCDDAAIECLTISKKLREILQNDGIEYAITEFLDGSELLESECMFDIVFLDIKMKKINGIKTAELLRKKNKRFILIFITAYEEYVYDAFDVEAFNYILKPVDNKKLETVLHKSIERISCTNDRFIVISKNRQAIKIDLNEVNYFEARGRIIKIHCKNHLIEYYEKLSNLDQKLCGQNFFRCHKSYLINLQHVVKFDKNEILMDNGDKVLLSKRKYNDFTKAILAYMKKEGNIL